MLAHIAVLRIKTVSSDVRIRHAGSGSAMKRYGSDRRRDRANLHRTLSSIWLKLSIMKLLHILRVNSQI